MFEDESHLKAYQKYWEKLFHNKSIHSFLDVSIGSGSVTLPIANMGIQLYGYLIECEYTESPIED